jgi:hypothetical protein
MLIGKWCTRTDRGRSSKSGPEDRGLEPQPLGAPHVEKPGGLAPVAACLNRYPPKPVQHSSQPVALLHVPHSHVFGKREQHLEHVGPERNIRDDSGLLTSIDQKILSKGKPLARGVLHRRCLSLGRLSMPGSLADRANARELTNPKRGAEESQHCRRESTLQSQHCRKK